MTCDDRFVIAETGLRCSLIPAQRPHKVPLQGPAEPDQGSGAPTPSASKAETDEQRPSGAQRAQAATVCS